MKMLKFVEGDFFDYEADIRINTVNCVGVMGAGVALLFKEKYPEMYKQYVKDCKEGILKPGKPSLWSEGDMFSKQTYIVNFPTKDHWKNKSKYEYIEEGLVWLENFLSTVSGKTVTLPALGCGHGGLDWNIVKEMIEKYLGKNPNEILVFQPSSSKKIKNNYESKWLDSLKNTNIHLIQPKDPNYPDFLKYYTEKNIFIFNKYNLYEKYDFSLISSSKPDEIEINLIQKIINNVNGTFIFGGTSFDLKIAKKRSMQGQKISIFLPSGISSFIEKNSLDFRLDDIEILSFGDPNKVFDKTQYIPSALGRILFSKKVLLTCSNIEWLGNKKNIDLINDLDIDIYYSDNLIDVTENRMILESINARPISNIINV